MRSGFAWFSQDAPKAELLELIVNLENSGVEIKCDDLRFDRFASRSAKKL